MQFSLTFLPVFQHFRFPRSAVVPAFIAGSAARATGRRFLSACGERKSKPPLGVQGETTRSAGGDQNREKGIDVFCECRRSAIPPQGPMPTSARCARAKTTACRNHRACWLSDALCESQISVEPFDDFHAPVDPQCAAVQRKIVILCVAPFHVGIKPVIRPRMQSCRWGTRSAYGPFILSACRILSKCSLLHGGFLRGPPIPSASGRRQYEGIENGGLELCLNPPQYPENPLWAHEATCPATVFSFPVWRGRLKRYLFFLYLNQPFCISSK